MQTRIDSLMEALTNVVIGFSINFAANVVVLPLVLGVPVNFTELGFIGAIYTVISVVRSYSLRRAFNGKSAWQAIKDRFGGSWIAWPEPILSIKFTVTTTEERAEQARQRVKQLIERP